MRFFQTIKLALKSIKSNKMRSALTMVGIIIGISSVIIMVALGSGSSKNITQQVQSLGTNLITVSVMGSPNKTIGMDDIRNMEALEGVKDVAPVVSGNVTLKAGRESDNYTMTGTTTSFLDIRSLKLSAGRFVCDLDNERRNKVAVLGANVATELFGFADPIQQAIKVDGSTYKVVGILEAQGGTVGSSTDDAIIVPVTSAMTLVKNREIRNMYIQASDEASVDKAISSTDRYLTKRLKSDGNKTHGIMSQKQLLDTMGTITKTLSMLLGGIAGISLVVGGIGIMNVMLVSVTERTKEIGIRKALGGKRKDILFQFLIEALVLSGIGGLIGIGVGIGGGYLATVFGMSVDFSAPVIMLAFGFSMGVGLVFGIFPAYKASRLKPIDALRFE